MSTHSHLPLFFFFFFPLTRVFLHHVVVFIALSLFSLAPSPTPLTKHTSPPLSHPLLSPNSIFFPVVCLFVMSLGAIFTTMNPLNTPREIAKQIRNSKPVLAFTTFQLLLKLATADLLIILMDEEHNRVNFFSAVLPSAIVTKEFFHVPGDIGHLKAFEGKSSRTWIDPSFECGKQDGGAVPQVKQPQVKKSRGRPRSRS